MGKALMSYSIDYASLERRLGKEAFGRRMQLQTKHAARVFAYPTSFFHPENLYGIHALIRGSLTVFGLYGRFNRQFKEPQVVWNTVVLPELPQELEGLTILHLTDLHLDIDPGLSPAIVDALKGADLKYDYCVITGDFRYRTSGAHEECMAYLRPIVDAIEAPIFGVLGNHDYIEMVTPLEEMGVRVLLNESLELDYEDVTFYLGGVDDPHFYRGADLSKTFADTDPGYFRILLSHSPESYLEAARSTVDLMLCGHTHGGQICLPGGIPVFTNSRAPRYTAKGAWKYEGLRGYTSRGTGGSGVAVRICCLPEITLHRLTRKHL